MNWYFMKGGERKGPVNLDGLKDLLEEGEIDQATLIWNKGMGDEWAKVSDVPALAGPTVDPDDEAAKEAFRQKMAERERLLSEQRKASLQRNGLILVVVIALIVGISIFVRGKDKRSWGVSSSAPIGTLAKLEDRLVGEYKMSKVSVERSPLFGKDGMEWFVYSEPKCERGGHITALGSVTVAVDGAGALSTILAAFPSPGLHGPTLMDRSIVSIFTEELWAVYGGTEKREFESRDKTIAKIGSQSGFMNMPPDAACSVIEEEGMRGVWAVFGPYTASTIVCFEAK